jgi:leucyl/phenylalanyl-tRNA--protein transferase
LYYYLSDELAFPAVEEADSDGLLAVGGDLSTERLILAYQSGIFPWYSDGQPILWWSPDPRMVLFPSEFRVSKSLKKLVDRGTFDLSRNRCFDQVIHACATTFRKGQGGTWITPAMEAAYSRLHRAGRAISWEVYQDGVLVGGLYGVDLPEYKIFCGESMFSHVPNASKVAFYHLVEDLKAQGYRLIDCQQPTPHLASLGARAIPRREFLDFLTPLFNRE